MDERFSVLGDDRASRPAFIWLADPNLRRRSLQNTKCACRIVMTMQRCSLTRQPANQAKLEGGAPRDQVPSVVQRVEVDPGADILQGHFALERAGERLARTIRQLVEGRDELIDH